MSNRIEQLYQQSFTQHTYESLVEGEIGDEPRYKTTKFAQLIIDDCMQCADWVGRFNTQTWTARPQRRYHRDEIKWLPGYPLRKEVA